MKVQGNRYINNPEMIKNKVEKKTTVPQNIIFYHLWIINIPISLNFHSNLLKLVHTFYTSLSILLDVKEPASIFR